MHGAHAAREPQPQPYGPGRLAAANRRHAHAHEPARIDRDRSLRMLRPPYLHSVSACHWSTSLSSHLQRRAQPTPRTCLGLGNLREHLAQLRLLQAVPWNPCGSALFPFLSHKQFLLKQCASLRPAPGTTSCLPQAFWVTCVCSWSGIIRKCTHNEFEDSDGFAKICKAQM